MIERALEARRLRVDNRRLAAEQTLGRRIVGDVAPMRRLLEATSRDRLARRHRARARRDRHRQGVRRASCSTRSRRARSKPLVRFNCAALPAELAEAELFGHCRGAFTGATATRPGFFAQADGGTLILDEVGELPPAMQAKLLRALQEGEIQPVGSGRIEKVDVRVVAATNRDLAAEVKAGTFPRGPLLPARGRRARRAAAARAQGRHPRARRGVRAPLRRAVRPRARSRSSRALIDALVRAEWPGNVRQLENTIARLAALSTGGVIGLADFRRRRRPATERRRPPPPDRLRAPPTRRPTRATARRSRSKSKPSSAASSRAPSTPPAATSPKPRAGSACRA